MPTDPDGSISRNVGEPQADGGRAGPAATLCDVPDTEESMRRVLVAAREHLDMDLSYCTCVVGDAEVVSGVYGDAGSFGLPVGARISFADAYSQAVIDGRLPNLVANVGRDGRAAGLVPACGSYVGVPLCLSDGRTDGMLCCVSHAPAPWLRDRDVAFLRVLGRMLVHELERSEFERAAQNHRHEAIALAALFAGLDARDSYTGRHSEAVVDLAAQVTRELGMSPGFVAEVKQVALLHDVGKIGIPDAILGKPGPLDEAEWELMYEHPIIGRGSSRRSSLWPIWRRRCAPSTSAATARAIPTA